MLERIDKRKTKYGVVEFKYFSDTRTGIDELRIIFKNPGGFVQDLFYEALEEDISKKYVWVEYYETDVVYLRGAAEIVEMMYDWALLTIDTIYRTFLKTARLMGAKITEEEEVR